MSNTAPDAEAARMEADWMSAFGVTFEASARHSGLTHEERRESYHRELHPDLRQFVEDMSSDLLMLRHPLIFDVPLFLPPAAINRRYEAKERQYRQRLDTGRYAEALAFIEKPYRLSVLDAWVKEGLLTPERLGGRLPLRECLRDAWVLTEYPGRSLTKRRAIQLFRLAGWMSDTVEGDVNHPDAPRRPDIPLRLWRGATARYRRGLAWTANPERAAWFARRWKDDAKVWQVTVPPQRMLASFNARGEAEIVCDVSGLEPSLADSRWLGAWPERMPEAASTARAASDEPTAGSQGLTVDEDGFPLGSKVGGAERLARRMAATGDGAGGV